MGPPGPPKYENNDILDIERKKLLSDCFRFYMYIDMGGRIAGNKIGPVWSLKGPQGPSTSQKLYIFVKMGRR